jgi:hypothetical protein
MYLRKDKQKYLHYIIKQDCLLFDRVKISLDEYFLKIKPKQIKSIDAKFMEPEFNTTRRFKQNIYEEKGNRIQPNTLKNNNNDLDNVQIYKIMGNNNIDLENNVQIINNNVVDKKIENTVGDTNTEEHDTPKPPESKSKVTFYNEITMRDYEALSIEEMFIYDNRSFKKYLKESLIRNNMILAIILKHSILDPIYIRISKFIFSISLIFGINAMLFNEDYIEQRVSGNYKVILY